MPVFLFVPLPPFFYAAIAKCWKVQLSNGLRKINLTTFIQKRHILTRTTMYIYIHIYTYIYVYIYTYIYVKFYDIVLKVEF